MNYITVEDINIMSWISWEDFLIENFISVATKKINSYLWISTLFIATYTNEEYNLLNSNIYYLNNINPITVTHINGVVVWNYKLEGRKLTLENRPVWTETIFNKVKITYIAWFSEIPEDIKGCMYDLVWFMYNNRKSQGINSFTQWQITVNYWNWKNSIEVFNNILSWIKNYKKNNILS